MTELSETFHDNFTAVSWPNQPRRALPPAGATAVRPAARDDLLSALASLRRPRLLIRAARLGQLDYCRNRDLKRLLQVPCAPAPETALFHLLEAEEELECARQQGVAGYSLPRHIELLIAIMAEAHLLPRAELRR